MNYLENAHPGNRIETIRRMREELILQLGVLTIAKTQGELYDKIMDELRETIEQEIELDA